MTLQQLKYVVTIAEKGNISKAAQELFVSQPSLTNSVKELENELSCEEFVKYVAEKLGLPSCGPYESVCILQNKGKFREFLTKTASVLGGEAEIIRN